MCGSGITLDKIHAHSSECAVVDMRVHRERRRVHRERRAAGGNTRDDEKRGQRTDTSTASPGRKGGKVFCTEFRATCSRFSNSMMWAALFEGGWTGGRIGVVGRLGERRSDVLSRYAR